MPKYKKCYCNLLKALSKKYKAALDGDMKDIKAYVVGKELQEISLYIADMTDAEKEIVKAGSLINFNRNRQKA